MLLFEMTYRRTLGLFLTLLLLSSSCTDGRLNTGNDTDDNKRTSEERETTTDNPSDHETQNEEEEPPVETDSELENPGASTEETVCPFGFFYEHHCWYLGDPNEDCEDVCEAYGGYNEETVDYIGTAETEAMKAENLAHCEAILDELVGNMGRVETVALDIWGLGLGCHVNYRFLAVYWVESPPFDPTHKANGIARVCSCGDRIE